MSQRTAYKVTAAIGLLATALILYFAVSLPDDFPFMLLTLAYSGIAAGVSWYFQVSSEELEVSERYVRASYWSVAKIALLGVVVYLAVVFLGLVAADSMINVVST